MSVDWKTFFEQESNRLEEEKKKRFAEKGYNPFWTAPEGVSMITILPEIPRDVKEYNRKAFTVINEAGEENDWTVNPNSPQYHFLINLLKDGQSHRVKVTRIGEGKNTRYSLKEA